jgi:hypothetical protein
MPHVAFHAEVLKKVIEVLKTAGNPQASLLEHHFRFAAAGAMGPNLLEHLPASKKLLDSLEEVARKHQQVTSLPTDQLEELFLRPSMAAYGLLFRLLVVPFWPLFAQIHAFLDRMDSIAQSEDTDGLLGEKESAEEIQAKTQTLKNLGPTIQDLIDAIAQIIAIPPWIQQTKFPWLPQGLRLHELLRWRRTGAFARNLLSAAGNDPLKAYALGYLVHVAGSITGQPLVNNIVGGPERTHWWRHRLVRNFVDVWTFGFYQSSASLAGDQPTPPYDQWKPLGSSNFQDQVNVGNLAGPSQPGELPEAVLAIAAGDLGGLPGTIPDDLAQLLQTAVDATYPVAQRPQGFSPEAFKAAFVGAYAVLWFLTSGAGPMTRRTLGAPPSSCTSPPAWVTSGGAPPSPQKSGPSTGGVVSAILLAILAIILFLTQNYAAGVGAVIGAIVAASSGGSVDWDQLRCNLYWLRKELIDAENALREALAMTGLAYPSPDKLGVVDPQNQTHPAVDKTAPNGVPLCKTNALSSPAFSQESTYPRQMDATIPAPSGVPDLNFAAYPINIPLETPAAMNFPFTDRYPNFVVDGAGLWNGGILTDGVYPSRHVFLGDAVSNAVELIQRGADGLANYNLDGDRGYGWKTWHPKAGTQPKTPPVVDVQEV